LGESDGMNDSGLVKKTSTPYAPGLSPLIVASEPLSLEQMQRVRSIQDSIYRYLRGWER
jgi:hypothetical protein